MKETDWDKLKKPPKWALKKIPGGRLQGMTDVKPMWRIQAMNDVFGPCGIGWKFEVYEYHNEEGSDGQKFAFALISLYYAVDGKWSAPVPGIGGSMLVAKEKSGLHNNDEAYKMAVTDALSSAMKMIGVAEDIYMGNWDGAKYVARKEPKKEPPQSKEQAMDIAAENAVNESQVMADYAMLCSRKGMTEADVLDFENAICNSKHEQDFDVLREQVVKKFDVIYKWWFERKFTKEGD